LKKNIDDLENFKNIDASMFSSMFWHLYITQRGFSLQRPNSS